MKNKIIKLIGMIGFAGILCITGMPGMGYIDNSPKVVMAGDEYYRYGTQDDGYPTLKDSNDGADFYELAMLGGFSKPYVAKALSDGLISQSQYSDIMAKLVGYGYLTEAEAGAAPAASSSKPAAAESKAAESTASAASAADTAKSSAKTAAKSTAKQIKSVDQVDATCTTPGSKTTYYTDGTKKTESIPATKHDYKLKDSKDATCTTAGYKTYTCSKCGDTYTDKTAALGHDFKLTASKDSTCTEAGYKTYTCSRCGEVKKQIIPKKDHTPGNWAVTKQAGLFTAGEKQQTCSVCGAVLKTETIPQTCPLPLAGVAGIAIGTAAVIAGAVILIRKRVKKPSKLNSVKG